MAPVPVFLYHAVSDDPPSWIAPFTVTPAAFAEQLTRLVDSGRVVIPLSRLVDAILHGAAPLPPRPAVLTFDDGFADFADTVFPELVGRGLPAVLYITTGAVRTPGAAQESLLPPSDMLTWNQIRSLDEAGVEIGGHSRTHPQLDALPRQMLSDEIDGCRRTLEDELGHAVHSYAYPHGYSDQRVRRCVREAGWTSACAVANAFSCAHDDPLRIARLTVRAGTPPEVFQDWLDGRGARRAPFHELPQTTAWRLYRRTRGRLGSPVGGPPSSPGLNH